ncbi:MAG: efflux RND transporter periplasmic adaptor subunit [Phycisphaerae bacterium]
MKTSQYVFLAVVGFGATLGAGVWAGAHWEMLVPKRAVAASRAGAAPATAAGSATAPQQLWTCAMHHQVLLPHPGNCPICGMVLTPVHMAAHTQAAGGGAKAGAGSEVVIDPVVVQNMGVRVAPAMRGELREEVRSVGTFVEPEENHVEINLRVSGWIEKLYADREGMVVTKGEPLFELYSPEITAASDELIAARKAMDSAKGGEEMLKSSAGALVTAARRKLELLGLSGEEIDALQKMDVSPRTITVRSPMHGHVAEKRVVEGSAVKAGDEIMKIADRSEMWLQVQVYEHDLPMVKVGTPVKVTVTAVPGKVFEGKVDFLYPHLDMASRTATARIVLPNENHELREGMYAVATVEGVGAKDALMVPREAVIDSGVRQVVFVSKGGGHFEPREVKVGMSGEMSGMDGEVVEVLSGVKAGEEVVTSGQFLLDSESRLEEALAKQTGGGLLEKGGGADSAAMGGMKMEGGR